MTREFAFTKPEHDLHTWREERAKIHPQKPCLTHSLTRKITSTKPEHDQHKPNKKHLQTLLRHDGLTRSSGRFFHAVKILSTYSRNYFQNSFVLIFTHLFTCLQIALTIATHLSVMTATVCELYGYSITFKTVAL